MTVSDHAKIMDRIKKCLALSASSNEHEAEAALRQARKLMEAHHINALLVTSGDGRLVGALNIHDLLRARVV